MGISYIEMNEQKIPIEDEELRGVVNNMQGEIDEVSRTLGYTVSKNLLCLDNAKGTSGAETVTRSGDSLTIKANISLNTYLCEFGTHKLKKGTYILSCKSTNYISDGSKCGWRIYKDGAWGEIAYSDTYEFTLDGDKDINIAYYLSVNNDVSVGTSVTLTELMLREASEDGTYVPYAKDVYNKLNGIDESGTFTNNNNLFWYRIGKIIHIDGWIYLATEASDGSTLFELPYSPLKTVGAFMCGATNGLTRCITTLNSSTGKDMRSANISVPSNYYYMNFDYIIA